MILLIRRPARKWSGDFGPWVAIDRTGAIADYIEPSPMLQALIEGPYGYVEAVRRATGWEIQSCLSDQGWRLADEVR